MSITLFLRMLISEDPPKIWKEGEEETGFKHQCKGRLGHALSQISKKFIPETRRGTLVYFIVMSKEGLMGWFVDGEPSPGGVANHSDHPDGVLLESLIRIADGPNDPSVKVGHSTDIVNDRKIGDIVEEPIDGNVPSEGILCRSTKAVSSNNISSLRLNLFEFRVTSKSRDLNNLPAFEEDMDQSKPTTDDPAISKEAVDLMGMGIRGDIKIFWDSTQEEITNTSPHKIGQEPMAVKAVEDL